MSCFGERRARGAGSIYLADGKTVCASVTCVEGMLVKDIVDKVCKSLDPPIVPVVRPLLTLCDMKTGTALCHTQRLNEHQCLQQYQLRVFVNAGDNSSCLRKYSRAARNYYYTQLRTDFVNGKLKMQMSSATGLHLTAIAMVLKSKELEMDTFEEVLRHCKISHFMPAYLKEQQAWKETIDHLFSEYHFNLNHRDEAVIKGQYIQVYERDSYCGIYQFNVKSSQRTGLSLDAKVCVSWKSGLIIKTPIKKETFSIPQIQKLICHKLDHTLTLHLYNTMEPDNDVITQTRTLIFKNSDDLITFCAVVDSYYHLKIDANSCVLHGDLESPSDPEYLGTVMKELCHGPISQESADQVFEQRQVGEGYFLVRESRTKDETFILSLFQREGIFNYRISREGDGRFALVDTTGISPVPKSVNSCQTLNALINHHHHFCDGLPILLKQNCPPLSTGPIPLFPSTDPASTPDPGSISEPEDDSPLIADLIAAGVERIDYEKHVILGDELGSGHFSSVYAAEWHEPGREIRKVAIKIPTFPKQSAEALGMLHELTREILTMYQLDHSNIVKLLAVTTTHHFLRQIGQFPMIVMEYINGGSLRGQLDRYSKHRIQNRIQTPPPPTLHLRYLNYSRQIAEAMNYLGLKNVVHRDLATRNVLVVSDDQVKISDFGLARQYVENQDYYKSKGGSDLPVYWYAPECLENFRFSQASDVWSFGVTIWEIFTLGRRPQEFLEAIVQRAQSERKPPLEALAHHFKQNHRLPMLSPCSQQVYDIIKPHCWSLHPERRLGFSQLERLFNDEYKKMLDADSV